MTTDRETRHARYFAGICVDCGEREHSAGRTRCDDCHKARHVSLEPGLKRQETPRRSVRIRRRH